MEPSLQRNEEIKHYIQTLFVHEDPFAFVKEEGLSLGMKDLHVPPHVGKLLYLLTKLQSPKKALEIGTFGGYSSLWIAKGLPLDGHLTTLEIEPAHAALAKKHFVAAGMQDKIEVLCGDAVSSMKQLLRNLEKPFDLIFIDADKENYCAYLDLALELGRPGTLLITDNLIPKGEAIGRPAKTNKTACAIYAFNEKLAKEPRLESVLTNTIARKEGRIDALGVSIFKSPEDWQTSL